MKALLSNKCQYEVCHHYFKKSTTCDQPVYGIIQNRRQFLSVLCQKHFKELANMALESKVFDLED
jgi:hypothetical protein